MHFLFASRYRLRKDTLIEQPVDRDLRFELARLFQKLPLLFLLKKLGFGAIFFRSFPEALIVRKRLLESSSLCSHWLLVLGNSFYCPF